MLALKQYYWLYFIYSIPEARTESKTLNKKVFFSNFVGARPDEGHWMETEEEELHGGVLADRQRDRRWNVHCHRAVLNRAMLNGHHLDTTAKLNVNCQQTEWK